jgi:hypothetical protein
LASGKGTGVPKRFQCYRKHSTTASRFFQPFAEIPFPKRFGYPAETQRSLAIQAARGFFRVPEKTAHSRALLIWIKAGKGLGR